jgi:hypothetical protein
MRYVRRSAYVDALEFTPELGALTERNGQLHVSEAAEKLGVEYAEGRGYSYAGAPMKFGDFMVLTNGVKPVWSSKDFTAQFKPKGDRSS